MNYTASQNTANDEIHRDYFVEEIDINDFPQQARWKITAKVFRINFRLLSFAKETIAAVVEITDCSVTVKGQYVPPNKTPEQMGTDRRLYLLLEGI